MPPGVPGRALQYVVLTPCSRPLRWGRRSESAPSGRSRPDELRVGNEAESSAGGSTEGRSCSGLRETGSCGPQMARGTSRARCQIVAASSHSLRLARPLGLHGVRRTRCRALTRGQPTTTQERRSGSARPVQLARATSTQESGTSQLRVRGCRVLSRPSPSRFYSSLPHH